MTQNSLETIEYVESCKNTVIYYYKERYKRDNLKLKNIWIVIRILLQIVGPEGLYPVDKKFRRKVLLKTLNKMTSDSYIESSINWEEFNDLNSMIDNLNMNDIEDIENEIYRDLDGGICKCC